MENITVCKDGHDRTSADMHAISKDPAPIYAAPLEAGSRRRLL
jgi:hypothetical protein